MRFYTNIFFSDCRKLSEKPPLRDNRQHPETGKQEKIGYVCIKEG